MKVRYLTSEASHTWTREYGQIYDLPDDEAAAAIAAGKAEPVADEPEAATRAVRETAVKPSARVR